MKIEFFLENTLLNLLKTKSIDGIHVKDIIQELGICKGTFYKYYQDKYDLVVHAFENKFYCNVEDGGSWERFVVGSLRQFRSSPTVVYNAFLSTDINSISQYHQARIKALFLAERAANKLPCDGIEIEYAVNILTWLVNETMRVWLRNGCIETEEETLAMIKRMMPCVLVDKT